jgi:hypothetical protein
MINVKLSCSDNFLSEAKYIFKFFTTALGISNIRFANESGNQPSLLVYYGVKEIQPPANSFLIHIANSNYSESLKKVKLAEAKKEKILISEKLSSELFYLFSGVLSPLKHIWYQDNQKTEPLISVSENKIHCSIDIIASAFYLLSLENERQTDERDNLDRFNQSFSALGNQIYKYPIVDQYLLLFERFLKEAEKYNHQVEFKNRWPNNHRFALVLSHDIDRIRTWTYSKVKRTLKESWRKRNYSELLKKPFNLLYSLLLKENWSGNFEYINNMENRHGGNSTFFFTAKKRSSLDPKYNLNWNRLKKGITIIKNKGGKIGLHGSLLSSEEGEYLVEEKVLLEEKTGIKIKGNRQHYLRFDISKSFDNIEKAGLEYDSTLGFANELGFRCGTSLPFHPFCIKGKKPYPFLEIPLILMDTVLLLESKLYLNMNEAWNIIEWYLQNALKTGLCLTINWHNNNINKADVFGYGELYEQMLAWANERNAWICSPDEIYDWWDNRTKELDQS